MAEKRRCQNCGKTMVQQFIGLKHCKCGMSWQKGIGYFERTGDMAFALQRVKVGKKLSKNRLSGEVNRTHCYVQNYFVHQCQTILFLHSISTHAELTSLGLVVKYEYSIESFGNWSTNGIITFPK